MYPYGKLDTLHDNGLISYTDGPVRSDGLPIRVALKTRVKAIEQKLEAIPKGKVKARQDTKERKALMKAHDEALDELAQYTLEGEDGVDDEDEVDDFDALMAGLEDDAGDDIGNIGGSFGNSLEDEDEESDEEVEEPNLASLEDEEERKSAEPPSFSRIPTAIVHQHLNLPTTAIAPSTLSKEDFPSLQKTSAPFVVTLEAGEMLYLPASWWHEVTSSSGVDDSEPIHMAFNYWFYPPNQLHDFDEPYEDTLVWEYFRSKQNSGGNQLLSNDELPSASKSKRKGDTEKASQEREAKRSRK